MVKREKPADRSSLVGGKKKQCQSGVILLICFVANITGDNYAKLHIRKGFAFNHLFRRKKKL